MTDTNILYKKRIFPKYSKMNIIIIELRAPVTFTQGRERSTICNRTETFLNKVLTLSIFCFLGANEEQLKAKDLHDDRYRLIRVLRNLSITLPAKTTEEEWEGAASTLVRAYEDKIGEYFQTYALIMANRGTKIWTVWNAIVYCATVYTTLGKKNFFNENFKLKFKQNSHLN